jgi:MEKHLA domain
MLPSRLTALLPVLRSLSDALACGEFSWCSANPMGLNPGAKAALAKTCPMTLATDPGFFRLLTESYARLLRERLTLAGADAAWLYRDAPFAVLAHSTEDDPKFIYANRAAQLCFDYTWDEFMSLPSRLSAEAPERAERQALLDEVSRHGFMTGYRGVRVAKSGRRFIIEDGIVWELRDRDGKRHGQAATFTSWRNL